MKQHSSTFRYSLAIQQEIGDKSGQCAALFNMGYIYHQNKESEKAIKTWLAVYVMAKPMQLAEGLDALQGLADQLGWEGGLEAWEHLLKDAPKDVARMELCGIRGNDAFAQ